MSDANYWDARYSDPESTQHHILQNLALSRDLMAEVEGSPVMDEAFRNAHTVLEVGCGTGDLSAHISRSYSPSALYATDSSRAAVNAAQKRYPQINFWTWDVLNDTFQRSFSLGISSNTVEHFTDPHVFIDRMLAYCKQVLIVAPYRQKTLDDFDCEGGAGHVSRISKGTFAKYTVRSSKVFTSAGWVTSTGEEAQQIAVLLRAK